LVTKSVIGSAKRFFEKDRKMALFIMIISHVQLLLGFSLYFMRGYQGQLGEMGNALLRFRSLEHPLGMVIAILLITMGYGRIKRATSDAAKFKAVKVLYGIALIIILISIPWPFREGMAHYGWF
ncbi:MAG: cytochrome B, partial [Flavobacteriales bacterium]|nr:cytochrome B [Flavobacteriales bacterium]